MVIGLFPNVSKLGIREVVARAVNFLHSANVEFCLPETESAFFGLSQYATSLDAMKKSIDIALSLGGDGTMVKCARMFAGTGVALCGVNLGRVGFLNDVAPDALEEALMSLSKRQFQIGERMMIKAEVRRNGKKYFSGVALNDAVISKSGLSRLLRLSVFTKEGLVETYPADGVIVATPTGSTGYSLSANGPIVHPSLRALVVTPICPHLLHSRSLLVAADEEISIRFSPAREEAILTLDGQIDFKLDCQDEVVISELEAGIKFVRITGGGSFFQMVREKLHAR